MRVSEWKQVRQNSNEKNGRSTVVIVSTLMLLLLLILPVAHLQAKTSQNSSSLWLYKNQYHYLDSSLSKVRLLSTNYYIFSKKLFEKRLKEQSVRNLESENFTDIKIRPIIIEIPLPDKTLKQVQLIAVKASHRRLDNIHTWKIVPDNDVAEGRVSYTDLGLSVTAKFVNGKTVLIDPVHGEADRDIYQVRWKSSSHNHAKCHSEGFGKPLAKLRNVYSQKVSDHNGVNAGSDGKQLDKIVARSQSHFRRKKLRLAITTTGEFAQNHGGSINAVRASVITLVNKVNAIFERDLGITLELVQNNDYLLYLDPDQDPFNSQSPSHIVQTNQFLVDKLIGTDNYDIAHVLSTSGGGLAYAQGACDTQHKAMGFTGVSGRINDRFAFDFFAHELGHQLGAYHTFNSTMGLCGAGHSDPNSAVEPGSGSSVMSYAGYCAQDNIQHSVDSFFHYHSILQIKETIWNPDNSSCGIELPNSNVAPAIEAKSSYHIPAQTPFELTASVKDQDDKQLAYSWHQMDSGKASRINIDATDNAILKTRFPSRELNRTIPSMNSLLNNELSLGETLPTTQRIINMMFTAYDGVNIATQPVKIYVHSSKEVFSFTDVPHKVEKGEKYTLKWNTANTELPPIQCHEVDIALSDNDGMSFDYSLVKKGLNSGSAKVEIPNNEELNTDDIRFKLSCSDNIFFTLSDSPEVLANRLTASATAQSKSEKQTGGAGLFLIGSQVSVSQYVLFLIIMFGLIMIRLNVRA